MKKMRKSIVLFIVCMMFFCINVVNATEVKYEYPVPVKPLEDENNLSEYYSNDTSYKEAYDEVIDSPGQYTKDPEELKQEASWNVIFDSKNPSYNEIATLTAGKIVPQYSASFYVGYDEDTRAPIYEGNMKVTIPAGQSVLSQNFYGTDRPLSNVYDTEVTVAGYHIDVDGTTWIKVSYLNPATNLYELYNVPSDALPDLDMNFGLPSTGHIRMSQSERIYSNYEDTEIEISDEIYDVSQGVPTSEYIKVRGKAPKALYFIAVRTTTITAWCDPVTIMATASWEYDAGCSEDCVYSGDYEVDHVPDWKETHVEYQTCVTGYEDKASSSFVDVPTSSIYELVSITVTETNETYSTYKLKTTKDMTGIGGPGPDTLDFELSEPFISSPYMEDDEGNKGHNAEAVALSAAKNSSGQKGKDAVHKALTDAISASVQGDPIDYEFCGLVVNTKVTGYPDPGYDEVNIELLIPETYPNGKYSPQSDTNASNYPDCYFSYKGYPHYKNEGEENGKCPELPNDVFVHTPVVNRASITSVGPFVNQKVNIDQTKEKSGEKYYLMLDEEFTITIPDSGRNHEKFTPKVLIDAGNAYSGGWGNYNSYMGAKGYGKDFTTWAAIKDVKFPFDVYVNGNSGKKYFLKTGTWMSDSTWWATSKDDVITSNEKMSDIGTTYTFTIPVWVTEQVYSTEVENSNPIEVRVIAENAYGDTEIDSINHLNEANNTDNYEFGANTDITNYVALKYIDCEVIGKIYDLRINASNDPGWTQVYSHKTRNEYIMANEFPFGQQGHNRVTQYKYAPKLGYTFVFNFKTKGRKSNNIDVSIQPEGFYFVSKTGGTAQQVDLYYDSTTTKNIKIQPGDTIGSVTVRLADSYMEVPSQEFVDSNRIYQKEIKRVYNYGVGVKIGDFATLNLPHSLRLCYDNFAEYVGKLYGTNNDRTKIIADAEKSIIESEYPSNGNDRVIGSVGHWWAGYRLPASTKAVEKGSNIQDAIKNNKLLTDGYILVKFNIKTKYKNESGNWEYLEYMGPEALNEGEFTGSLEEDWTKDGNKDITLPNGQTASVPIGTVAIFEADLRSSNDSEVGGTH